MNRNQVNELIDNIKSIGFTLLEEFFNWSKGNYFIYQKITDNHTYKVVIYETPELKHPDFCFSVTCSTDGYTFNSWDHKEFLKYYPDAPETELPRYQRHDWEVMRLSQYRLNLI